MTTANERGSAMELNILEMDIDRLRSLNPDEVDWGLSEEEILHMVDMTDNYVLLPAAPPLVARGPVPKYHIKLKSGLCSNGFINFKILLKEYPNLRKIYAKQIAHELEIMFKEGYERPDWIVGVPDAATELGEDVANILGIDYLKLKKEDGRILLDEGHAELLKPGVTILIIEDLCTKGTGVTETILQIMAIRDDIRILNYIMYIVNRGTLEEVVVEGVGSFKIIPLARRRIDEYQPGPDTCPYCANGSEPIKAKDPVENWRMLKRMEMIN